MIAVLLLLSIPILYYIFITINREEFDECYDFDYGGQVKFILGTCFAFFISIFLGYLLEGTCFA